MQLPIFLRFHNNENFPGKFLRNLFLPILNEIWFARPLNVNLLRMLFPHPSPETKTREMHAV